MAAGIATGFVRKLYRILDQESDAIVSWDADGASFSIHDSDKLNELVLPRYFRGRLSAFRQQLVDHGFQQVECEDNESREVYRHADFLRGCPGRLSKIVRAPKPKKKKASDTIVHGVVGNGNAPQANIGLPAPPTSLKVTLTAMGGKRKSGTAGATLVSPSKRLRADADKPKAKNPLFSNDPDDGAFSIARLVEGSGLLPASTELPDPISYLSKLTGMNAGARTVNAQSKPPTQMTVAPAFSDDLVRSALYFLVSSSMTGTEAATAGDAAPSSRSTEIDGDKFSQPADRAEGMRSDLLASLLASSTSGAPLVSGWASNPGTNPLFSDQSAGDDGEEEDSIWNLLVASSVDRVKTAIGDVVNPREKLKLIIAERERLEEQRKKVGIPVATQPSIRQASKPPMPSAAPPPSANPLFAKEDSSAATKVKTNGKAVAKAGAPSEDDLWRLLMSSSIDAFRNLEQFEV